MKEADGTYEYERPMDLKDEIMRAILNDQACPWCGEPDNSWWRVNWTQQRVECTNCKGYLPLDEYKEKYIYTKKD